MRYTRVMSCFGNYVASISTWLKARRIALDCNLLKTAVERYFEQKCKELQEKDTAGRLYFIGIVCCLHLCFIFFSQLGGRPPDVRPSTWVNRAPGAEVWIRSFRLIKRKDLNNQSAAHNRCAAPEAVSHWDVGVRVQCQLKFPPWSCVTMMICGIYMIA